MFKLKTAPVAEPISTTNAKLFLKVTHATEDTLIANMVKAARQFIEKFTKRSFVTQTWEYYADKFPTEIELYYGPVASVTSVKYYDTDGTLTTLGTSLWQSDLISNPARILPAVDQTWPDTQADRLNAVVVEYIAGVATPEDQIVHAIYLLLGHIYANRQDVVIGHRVEKMPKGSEYLVSSLKLF
jgi:uncharacterized phiE125 gp8 family phage protein